MSNLEAAQARFNRADKLYHYALRAFFAFAAIMLVVIVYQVAHLQSDFTRQQNTAAAQRDEDTVAARQRLEGALKETQEQQIVTQNYIRCVASVLLKPVATRTEADFDNCGIPGVTDPSQLGQPRTNASATVPQSSSGGGVTNSSPAPVAVLPAPQAQTITPTPTQETTSGAPPPDDDERSTLGRLPLVGGLLDNLGL